RRGFGVKGPVPSIEEVKGTFTSYGAGGRGADGPLGAAHNGQMPIIRTRNVRHTGGSQDRALVTAAGKAGTVACGRGPGRFRRRAPPPAPGRAARAWPKSGPHGFSPWPRRRTAWSRSPRWT